MGFLKTSWKAIVGALLAFLAILASASAARHKKTADKWRHTAAKAEIDDLQNGAVKAKAALSQAKLHDERAHEAKIKARSKLDRLGEQDEELADTLSRWKQSNRMRNRS